MTRIAVIDHGAGNMISVTNALEAVGAATFVVTTPEDVDGADGLLLPGVGATAPAMSRLSQQGFDSVLKQWKRPLLGICVGLQLFFERSAEDDSRCLGIMGGEVTELINTPTLPHMGWNEVSYPVADSLFRGIDEGSSFYFVHSYAPSGLSNAQSIAQSTHGGTFVAAARRNNVVGTQFHPERSGRNGLQLLSNWLEEVALAC